MKGGLWFAVALAVLLGVKFLGGDPSANAAPEQVNQYPNEVVLYATSWCGYCKKTRKLLRDNNIQFTEYDVENSARGSREFNALEGKGIPLMVIDGEVIRGYKPDLILQSALAVQKQRDL
ncbi:glutaredoxin family protein [Gilvimarinus agarilyticus]|uniref:glutaredoxin family protein n=1 Tax=unclassified Gilvimarinus TaxID=2642066 RepID=UPI001C08FB3F|nr:MULTISPECIES: glutaredoxin family protein [unclassified Gilvimarinus]MBU2885590.1 glutaredoxin family protein [Gilvimarinus agarilyticus]MDO6570457.1 glutaredoxin family protein [Gilvimarinus sp. 2_MG-2023]MDO6746508.1 glutaredoxin family protein [Gilvimarinus sp. 1_MG-2023]